MPPPIRSGSRPVAVDRPRTAARATARTAASARAPVDALERARPASGTTRATGAPPTRATGLALADGVTLHAGTFVLDGVPLRVGPTSSPGRAGLLLELAQRLAGTRALERLSQAARKALADDLMDALAWRARGRPSLTQTRVHAASFALLEAVRASARAPSERALVRAVDEALAHAAAAEAHAPLEMHMKERLEGLRTDTPVFLPAPPFPDARSISFRPDARATPDDVSRAALTRGVVRLDALWGTWAARWGNADARALQGALVHGGFFDARDGDAPVRVTKRGDTFAVALDRRFARMDPDAIALQVVFHGARALLGRAHPNATEHQSRMIALMLAARMVHDDVPHADIADLMLARFAKANGFPPSLSFAAVDKAMQAEGSDSASPKSIALLERAMEFTFLEVNARRTSTAFRRYIGKALDLLMRSSAPVGRRTYEAIATGKVTVDELSDLNAADYARLRRDFAKDGVHVHARDEGVIDKRSMRAITTSIAGYMWDDRVYVARGMDPADVARALVHEVNHVLNESEEHYRAPQTILVEEYRAFYAEELFIGTDMTPARCRALKERVIADYGLRGVTPDDVPDVPPGIV